MKSMNALKSPKIKVLALGIGLLALGLSTPSNAYYHRAGFGPGFMFGTAAGIITGAAIASQGGYYYGPGYYYPHGYRYYPYGYGYYGYSQYPYYRAGYSYGNGYYYAGCQRVFVRCHYYHHYHHLYRQCYRYIHWVC